MMKQLATLAVFAGIAIGASDSSAQTTIFHPPGGGTGSGTIIANACTQARTQAIANGRTNIFATAQCVLSTSHGNVNVQFDHTGMVAQAWTYDAQGVGHLFHTTHSLTPGVHINSKNYHGPILATSLDWYTTNKPFRFSIGTGYPAPSEGNDPSRANAFVQDGRTYYKRLSTDVAIQTDLGQVQLTHHLITATKDYLDQCMLWTKHAESTSPNVTPTGVVAHFDNDGTQHEKYTWDGGPVDFTKFSCGSYLPVSTVQFVMPNVDLFTDVSTAFGFSATAAQNFLNGVYVQKGANPANPLSIFKIAHAQRMSFGLHPLSGPNTGWLGDGWSQHAQGIIDSSLISGLGGGLGGLVGGGPIGAEVGFAVGFCTTYFGAVITDIDNGIDPRTGEKPGAQLDTPELRDDEVLTAMDEELVADWDGNANDPYNDDTDGPEPSGGADDGAGNYLDGSDGGDSCGTNPNACFPQARIRAPQ